MLATMGGLSFDPKPEFEVSADQETIGKEKTMY
jgi:hypothetical protein